MRVNGVGLSVAMMLFATHLFLPSALGADSAIHFGDKSEPGYVLFDLVPQNSSTVRVIIDATIEGPYAFGLAAPAPMNYVEGHFAGGGFGTEAYVSAIDAGVHGPALRQVHRILDVKWTVTTPVRLAIWLGGYVEEWEYSLSASDASVTLAGEGGPDDVIFVLGDTPESGMHSRAAVAGTGVSHSANARYDVDIGHEFYGFVGGFSQNAPQYDAFRSDLTLTRPNGEVASCTDDYCWPTPWDPWGAGTYELRWTNPHVFMEERQPILMAGIDVDL